MLIKDIITVNHIIGMKKLQEKHFIKLHTFSFLKNEMPGLWQPRGHTACRGGPPVSGVGTVHTHHIANC